MTIFLFTDFGAADIYVGQVKAVLDREAPGATVIDLLHDAPAFQIEAGAHLLAALGSHIPPGSITMAVVDPGVGTQRAPVILEIDDRFFVGPDNGLMSVLTARANRVAAWKIAWRPAKLSASFHGLDLFAPVAAALASGESPAVKAQRVQSLDVEFGPADLAQIIYIDHYGNALTGLRAAGISPQTRFIAGGRELAYRRVFGEAAHTETFWYVNSLGLVEIAANGASAVELLDLKIGDAVERIA